jgi:hypothetical protein
MLKISAHFALRNVSIPLIALSVHLPVPANAGSEFVSIFESPLLEKKATKSLDGVMVSASAESPADGQFSSLTVE